MNLLNLAEEVNYKLALFDSVLRSLKGETLARYKSIFKYVSVNLNSAKG